MFKSTFSPQREQGTLCAGFEWLHALKKTRRKWEKWKGNWKMLSILWVEKDLTLVESFVLLSTCHMRQSLPPVVKSGLCVLEHCTPLKNLPRDRDCALYTFSILYLSSFNHLCSMSWLWNSFKSISTSVLVEPSWLIWRSFTTSSVSRAFSMLSFLL